MDYYQTIADSFQATIHNIAMSVDSLAGPMEQASQLLVSSLLADRKIVSCGSGVDAAQAQLLTANLVCHFEQERPALPALCLGTGSASYSAISDECATDQGWSRELRALAQEGDSLLVINSASPSPGIVATVEAARERNMSVIALSNASDNQLPALLRPSDVLISIDANRRPRVVELHTMVLHSLCELLEMSLFGSYNQE